MKIVLMPGHPEYDKRVSRSGNHYSISFRGLPCGVELWEKTEYIGPSFWEQVMTFPVGCLWLLLILCVSLPTYLIQYYLFERGRNGRGDSKPDVAESP
jgi:hypothetical protein